MKRFATIAFLALLVLCGYGQNTFTVTLSVDPEEGGTATGGGTYAEGSTATLTATPNPGYFFLNWKRGDAVESSLSPYGLTVTENVELVARFATIPANGILIGQPTSTLEPLPTNGFYNYSLTQQIFTAAELGLSAPTDLSSVSFYNTGTAKTRNITLYMVNTNQSAFLGATNWIVPTEADQVFSGSVTLTAGLTTIYFNSPFVYDGTSNVALIVDDNTGTYSRGMYCRTSDAPNRTLYIYSDDTNYNPFAPSAYNGTVSESRNQVIIGVASYDYTVHVAAASDEGTVSVDEGPFYYGQLCTATATPVGDNVFYYWAENGERVSTDACYSFQVTGNKNLTAYFGPAHNVVVTANPEEGGTVTGGGGFGLGQPCSVTATANEGYLFANWTLYDSVMCHVGNYDFNVEGETVLSANFEKVPANAIVVGQCPTRHTLLPTYSYYNYSLTQQIYTADEIGQACHITSIAFFNTTYQKTRNLTVYMVPTDKETFESATDWVVATEADQVFSGEVTLFVNSWCDLFLDTPFDYDGSSNLVLIVDDNTCEWNNQHMACRAYETDVYQSIRIFNDNTNFDPLAPQEYTGGRLLYKNQIILGLDGYEHIDLGTAKTVEVYPNPAENTVFVEGEDINKVEIFNTIGQRLNSVETTSSTRVKIDVSNYHPAVYILKIHSGNGLATQRFVKE